MRIVCTLLCFSLMLNIFAQTQKPASPQKGKKAKAFFSMKDTDTLRERHSITTAAEPFPEKKKKWDLTWSGLVSMDIWDTRKPVEARDGGIYLYPADVLPACRKFDSLKNLQKTTTSFCISMPSAICRV